MKKIVLTLLFLVPEIFFPQFRIDAKSAIRPIHLNLDKEQTDRMNNEGSEADYVAFKKNDELKIQAKNYVLSIANPNRIPIIFASGTTDIMDVKTVESNTVWTEKSVDIWQNIAIKTGKNLFIYSVKTNNCYAFYWNKNLNAWDLKKIECNSNEKVRRMR